jgi:hypothetical protein
VITDARRPYVADRLSPSGHAIRVALLRARSDFRVVFDRDGVVVLRRVDR